MAAAFLETITTMTIITTITMMATTAITIHAHTGTPPASALRALLSTVLSGLSPQAGFSQLVESERSPVHALPSVEAVKMERVRDLVPMPHETEHTP